MAFASSDNFIFSGSVDSTVRVWESSCWLAEVNDSRSSSAACFGNWDSSESESRIRSASGANIDSLSSVMKRLKLEEYLPKFEEQKIDLDVLPLLRDEDMKEMNIPIGVRRKLLAAMCSTSNIKTSNAANGRDVERRMVDALRQFVEFKTISVESGYREECWQGAKFLQCLLRDLGAECMVVQGREGMNPIVLAKFSHTISNDTDPVSPPTPKSNTRRRRVLIYGHYDVQGVGGQQWDSNPFVLSGRNGHLYGRGATDNKGP
eukprot:342059_1